MRTTDNNNGLPIPTSYPKNKLDDIQKYIANRSVGDIILENPNLLVFPSVIGSHNDQLDQNLICSIHEKKLTTYNTMGYVGINDAQLSISSRFYPENNDFFLHYMLQRVFSLNIVDFKHGNSNDSIWDFLLYCFPYYLKKALNQGMYKEYERLQFNNSNIKGSVNVAQHIKENHLFCGKIVYDTRMHVYDNSITQLIRHTIEYIKNHFLGAHILKADSETLLAVNQIIFATPSYSRCKRESIIIENIKPFRHPYFSEYRELQRICLMILRFEKMSFGNEKNKIYGILFDGAWLWEEYLNTLLKKEQYVHSMNKIKQNPMYLLQKQKGYIVYPDFYKEQIVLDAKYKNLSQKIDRDDMYQLITYMHILPAQLGGFVYPKMMTDVFSELGIGMLNGYEGMVVKLALEIPQGINTFAQFIKEMAYSESKLINKLIELEKDHVYTCVHSRKVGSTFRLAYQRFLGMVMYTG